MANADLRQTANLLGALSLALTDRMSVAVGDATGFGGGAAAALVTIDAEPGNPIGFIAEVTGLTHSGTVRLIDKLEDDGLVVRRTGSDARTAALHVTAAGRRRVRAILKARQAALTDALAGLTTGQVSALASLLRPLLAHQMVEPMDEHVICRLCDTDVCYPVGCPLHRHTAAS